MEQVHRQRARAPISLAVHSPDELVAEQDRQAEVAVAALPRRHVALDGVVEAEQIPGPIPHDHGVVERREDGHPAPAQPHRQQIQVTGQVWAATLDHDLLQLPRLHQLGCRLPHQRQDRAGVEPGRGEALVSDLGLVGDAQGIDHHAHHEAAPLGGIGERRVHAFGQHPLGKIVDLLKPFAPGDHELAPVKELLEGALRRLPVPPPAAAMAGGLEVPGLQGPIVANAAEHLAGHLLVHGLAAPGPAHHGQVEAIVAHGQIGGRVGPVLEHRTILVLQVVEPDRLIAGHAAAQHVVMGALDHGDRVDLHPAEALDGAGHGPAAAAERIPPQQPLPVQEQPAGVAGGNVGDGRHGGGSSESGSCVDPTRIAARFSSWPWRRG